MISSLISFMPSLPIYFGDSASCNGAGNNLFNIIPTWYEYLGSSTVNGSCEVAFTVPNGFLAVGLAIVDMLLRLGGLVAMVAIIRAGLGYITAGGDVGKAAAARTRIWNSLIGIGIVIVASGFVAYMGNYLL